MSCSVSDRLTQVIRSDRRTIVIYCSIYPVVFAASIVVFSYFHFHPVQNDPWLQWTGAAFSGIAIPLVLQHIRRTEALRMLNLLLHECGQRGPMDPECKKIEDHVDAIIRVRMGAN